MNLKRKLIVFVVLVVLSWMCMHLLYGHITVYDKRRLAGSVLNTINAALFVYLFFTLGWGENYSKEPLRYSWDLIGETNDNYQVQRAIDSNELVAFNQFLLDKLNATAPLYRTLSLKEVNERAKTCYRLYTDSKVKAYGLDIKPTMFGYFMERVAVDGYYNPFTGEGQVSGRLPAFMLPFVVCHEMAHQAGIAAEGDANLMAYAVGTQGDDPSFNYSAYLNIWLYANIRLFRKDSAVARKFEAQLNKLTAAHIDTLEELSKKYNNEASRYSSEFYDSYLKMHNQKEGIRSYGNVVNSARMWEKKRSKALIRVP